LSNANLYLGIQSFLASLRGVGGWVLGFFEIEMDNNRQIVLYLLVSIKLAAVDLFRLVVVFFFYGEFDPGSGRTLAACLTHASRTMIWSLLQGLVANG
jgi:hypothetical protein